MLLGTTKEDLNWQAAPGVPSADDLLRNLAQHEERQIHGRVSRQPRELAALSRSTGRLVRSLLDDRARPKSATLLRDLEELTAQEMAVAGQVDLLCRLRLALADRTARPIPPGRAGHAVPERKSPARKASL
jgi:hypothetical protein